MKIEGKLQTRFWKGYIPHLFLKVTNGPNKIICYFQTFTHCSFDRGIILGNFLADVELHYCLAASTKNCYFSRTVLLPFNKGNVYWVNKCGVACEILRNILC